MIYWLVWSKLVHRHAVRITLVELAGLGLLLRIVLVGLLALKLAVELDIPVAHILSVDKRAANKIAR
jgi:hypothetical protein